MLGQHRLGDLDRPRRHHPPKDRRICICADDDKQHSPADKAVKQAAAEWRKAGISYAIATPWPARRSDSSDFNDLIQADGPAAVRARIHAALNPTKPAAASRGTRDDARTSLKAAVTKFYNRAVAYNKDSGEPPPALAIGTNVGIGKSDAARQGAVITLLELLPPTDTRSIGSASQPICSVRKPPANSAI